MDYLLICNTYSDDISKVNLTKFKEEKRINLKRNGARVGPHEMCIWNDKVIVANTYNSSISIVDYMSGDLLEDYFIGGHCNDVAIYGREAFITCGESNDVVIFDLDNKRVIAEVPCGNMPHSIKINETEGIAVVTNMESDSLTIFHCNTREVIKNIAVGSYPTKALFSKDNKYLFVCESYIGNDCEGIFNIISLDNFYSIAKVKAGKCPVDMANDDEVCYLSNFSEGYISLIYINDLEVVKKIYLGGMPRGIKKMGRFLYIGDNYSNQLIKYDIFKESKQVISIGKEPTGITIV